MSKGKKIFRQVALERLSSPEQLDQLMQVTDPKGWLALAALVLLVVVAIVWGIFGSIPTVAQGEGILIRRGGVSDLVATGEGQVEEILAQVGDTLRTGEVVARIRQDALERQIQDDEARLEHLRSEYLELVDYARQQRRLQSRNLAQERTNLQRTIETLENKLDILRQQLEAEKELLEDGLVTKQAVLQTEQELNRTRDELSSLELQLASQDLSRLESEQQLEQQIQASETAIRNLEFELREQRATLEENSRIVATDDGRVIELAVGRGDIVTPGTPILSMEMESEELMAVLFIPASSGKQVTPGMEARISPSNVKREEFGYVLGEVVWAAEFPSTTRGMMRLLSNEALVNRLMEQGPPIQVDVSLHRDPATPSGFEWSSSTGPDIQISSGTLASGNVIVKEERPMHLVIPKVRSSLGL